ncbi:MAG TPA: hypothetical protein VGC06_28905, partial [Actinomycetes bacterium]
DDDLSHAYLLIQACSTARQVSRQSVLLAGAGDGAVELLAVQPEGRRAMSGAEFARGARLGEAEWLDR